jgi:DNA-binding MarR family transcriptional regulator
MERKQINPYKLFHGAFIPNWLLQRTEVSVGAKLCYARLCQYAGNKGFCYPQHKIIATELGVNISSVKRHLKELVDFSLIEVERGKHNNKYFFLLSDWMGAEIAQKRTSEKIKIAQIRTSDSSNMNISIYNELKDSVKESNDILSESELSDEQNLDSSSIKKSGKRVKLFIDYQTQIDTELKKFGDLKSLAENFIAVAAGKNKTGTIAESRRLPLLCQLSAVLTATDDKGIFKDALLEVIAKGIDNINYLKKVVESKKQKKVRREANDDARFGFLKGHKKAGGSIQTPAVESRHT